MVFTNFYICIFVISFSILKNINCNIYFCILNFIYFFLRDSFPKLYVLGSTTPYLPLKKKYLDLLNINLAKRCLLLKWWLVVSCFKCVIVTAKAVFWECCNSNQHLLTHYLVVLLDIRIVQCLHTSFVADSFWIFSIGSSKILTPNHSCKSKTGANIYT